MTRQEQFEIFKAEVLRWHRALGLGEWRITYFRLKDADEDGAPVARVWFDLSQKCAWLQF
jgi:hypothetical protein